MSPEQVRDLIDRIVNEQKLIHLTQRLYEGLTSELRQEIAAIKWPPEIVERGRAAIESWARSLGQI